MPEYNIIVCQACKLSQIWSHILQNDPIKIKTSNYKSRTDFQIRQSILAQDQWYSNDILA